MPLAYRPGFEPETPEECDYCPADATHWHFADSVVNRDAYACDEHLVYLSRWHRNNRNRAAEVRP